MSDQEKIISFTKEDISLDEKLSNLPVSPGCTGLRTKKESFSMSARRKSSATGAAVFPQVASLEPRIALMVEKVSDVEIITTDPESKRSSSRRTSSIRKSRATMST